MDVGEWFLPDLFEISWGQRASSGSFLFEFEQTAAITFAEDVEGWVIEEERKMACWKNCKSAGQGTRAKKGRIESFSERQKDDSNVTLSIEKSLLLPLIRVNGLH